MARKLGQTPANVKTPRKSEDRGGDRASLKPLAAAKVEAPEKYSPHPLALLFPALDEDSFAALCADIGKNGQIHPIIVLDDQILDGWHRYRACQKTGVAAMFHQFTGNNPAAYVLSANLHRRHLNLTTEQKRTLIGKVLKESPELSDRQIAKITKTSHPTVAAERQALEGRGKISTSEKRTDTRGRRQPAKKPKPKGEVIGHIPGVGPMILRPPAELAADRRAEHTVNGSPRHSGSGDTTTSGVAIAARLLTDLYAQVVIKKVDPAKVAKTLGLKEEQKVELFHWLADVAMACGVTEGAAS